MAVPSDPFAEAENLCAIAISGAMNPAIHHPAWYGFIGAINSEEMALAATMPVQAVAGAVVRIQANQAFCSAQFSQFTAGNLRVTCIPETWTISATDASGLDRIKDIADKVFAALAHTPISGYTISLFHHRHTSIMDVGAYLAQAIRSVPLGIMRIEDAEELAQLRYIGRSPQRDLVVNLQPSAKAKTIVYIGINAVHRLPVPQPAKELQAFDLGPLLTKAVAHARSDAEEWVASITKALSGQGK